MNLKYILCCQSHGWSVAYGQGRQARFALVPHGEARTVCPRLPEQLVPLHLCTPTVHTIKFAPSNIFPGLPQRPRGLYCARFGAVKSNH